MNGNIPECWNRIFNGCGNLRAGTDCPGLSANTETGAKAVVVSSAELSKEM